MSNIAEAIQALRAVSGEKVTTAGSEPDSPDGGGTVLRVDAGDRLGMSEIFPIEWPVFSSPLYFSGIAARRLYGLHVIGTPCLTFFK